MWPWRRKHKRRSAEDPGIDTNAMFVLFAFFSIGIVLIYIGVPGAEEPTTPVALLFSLVGIATEGKAHSEIRALCTHLGGALVVAGIMGVTYELLMDRRRNRHHEAQIADIKQAVLQSIAGLTQFTAVKLLALLQDVARNLDRTPTLFPPARPDSECPFASNPQYFDAMIESAREDMLEVVQSWLRDSNENLRFLASDFVGKYEIYDFAAEMRQAADTEWLSPRWTEPDFPEKTKQWVLNYFWALSALEKNELQTLRGLLVTAPDAFTRKWILHVPQQMPQMEGVERLLADFLARVKAGDTDHGRTQITPEEAQAVIRSIAAIERHDRQVRGEKSGRGLELLRTHKQTFAGYRSFAAKAWVGMELDPKDLPPAEVTKASRVVDRDNGSVTLQYDDGLKATVSIVPRKVTPPEEEPTATLVGTTDAEGKFTPLYAQFNKGVLAPVLHIKS